MNPDDRRAKYRVDSADADAVEVALLRPSGALEPTELVDVNIEGAGLRFPIDRAPAIAVGERITIVLGALSTPDRLHVEAIVIHRREEREHRRYGLRFAEPQVLAKQLGPALARLFNRRAAPRVRPDPREPVMVTLEGFLAEGGVERTTAPMLDLATGGLGVVVDVAFESIFAGNVRVRTTFELPGVEDPFNVGAIIQNRRAVDGGVLYGLEFDPDRTLHFARQRRAIADYVARRYREESARA